MSCNLFEHITVIYISVYTQARTCTSILKYVANAKFQVSRARQHSHKQLNYIFVVLQV